MDDKFFKPYSPKGTEERIYQMWEESGYFNPDNLPNALERDPFSVVLPPPNVTGVLHVGHAYEDSLQDSIIRFQRMRGKRALWVPGTDSAAIATQAKVEKQLQKEEGVSRHQIGRIELVERVQQFAKASEGTILSQVRRMGASLDWSRYAYTLDDARSLAVTTAFKNMYEAGLIYRGHRTVNWDPKGQTTISDDEIVYQEEATTFYYLQYGSFVIGTARPETKFGDKYVVVHPDDARYQDFAHGQTFELEWINGPVTATVIKDTAIDPEFGTGAMTITPWHSMADFEIAERHELDKEQIIDEYGKLLPIAGDFAGMKIGDARLQIVERMREKGLLVKEEPYTHNIATAERTGGVIEPQVQLQWFIGVDKPFVIPHSQITGIQSGSRITLKQLMRAAVELGDIEMPQENFKKIYLHWVDNLHDWCISRQIWFGHRIPIWYRGSELTCQAEHPDGEGWEQDNDVLDTWFSSALWTFSTLGWPEKTVSLETYHPTSFMSPAYEILQLWVSRMILMSGFHLGQVPFKTVLIHGLVRDNKGRKFSKSLNNGIDPIMVIDTYGADALRLALLIGAAIGNDIKFDEQRVKGYKNFANKLWNIARFIIEKVEPAYDAPLTEEDQVLRKACNALIKDVTADYEAYRIYLAAEKIYHYIWHTLADELIESSKAILSGEDDEKRASRSALLQGVLSDCLKLLHPCMPFITEEIWQTLPHTPGMLMVADWPAA